MAKWTLYGCPERKEIMTTPKMRLKCGGVTGTCAPATEKGTTIMGRRMLKPLHRGAFGTCTTSFAIAIGERGFLIDNGTGAGNSVAFLDMMGVKKIAVLMTHLHKDHTYGMTAHNAWFRKGYISGIYAPPFNRGFQWVYETTFPQGAEDDEQWPVSPERFGMPKQRFVNVTPGEAVPDHPEVKTLHMNHVHHGSVGYRVETASGAIVIATDVELSKEADRMAFAEFISGAGILYVDIQYRQQEYDGKVGISGGPALPRIGWGHSTPEMLLDVLKLTRIPPCMVLVGHHDPTRDEAELLKFECEAQALLGAYTTVQFARECGEY